MPNDDTDAIARLFWQEVPEIASGIVQIKAIARKTLFLSKIALISHDPEVDCVGVCVGIRGCRIAKIVDQLDGERIDLFRWDEGLENLVRQAVQPAQLESVTPNPAQHRVTVVVKEDQRYLAFGRGNINRDLASQLCAWDIEIVVDPSA